VKQPDRPFGRVWIKYVFPPGFVIEVFQRAGKSSRRYFGWEFTRCEVSKFTLNRALPKMMISSTKDYAEWYNRVYPDLTGYGQWLRGNELNTLDPQEYILRPYRILIARLSTYFDTSESFSHKVLYQIARGNAGIFPDIGFLPPLYDGPVFSRDNTPWLLGTATKQGPSGFDLIAFSNAIVQEMVNVPVLL
jgi:hypothetical protein